jgi:hypothetical protein
MVDGAQKGVSVPLVRPEVRRDFCRNAVALRNVLPIRRGDQDDVYVDHVLRRMVCGAAVTAFLAPGANFHQPTRESHNAPFANGGVLARRVDVAQDPAVLWQVSSRPSLRLWCFLVELLLKFLEANESHERGSPSRAEVVLGQILERVGRIVRINWLNGHLAAGGTVVVNRSVLFDILKGELTLHGKRFSAG